MRVVSITKNVSLNLLHLIKCTLTHLCPQLSEPRRLHLDEENVLLQLNADHVLRHTSPEVMRPHDHSPVNEKNGVGFEGLEFNSKMARVCTAFG